MLVLVWIADDMSKTGLEEVFMRVPWTDNADMDNHKIVTMSFTFPLYLRVFPLPKNTHISGLVIWQIFVGIVCVYLGSWPGFWVVKF